MKTATLMQVTDRLTHQSLSTEMYFNPAANAKKNFTAFDVTARISGEGDDHDLCDELFDLTNNPYRQHERPNVPYSMSVGDVVVVNDEDDHITVTKVYVCCRDGWERI